jgi:hypothetical protein
MSSVLKALTGTVAVCLFSIILFTQRTEAQQWVQISGTMAIVDDDFPFSPQRGTRSIGPTWRWLSGSTVFADMGCVGEVRGTVRVSMVPWSGGWVQAKIRGRLYEGAGDDCTTMDKDGEKTVGLWIPPDATRSVSFFVGSNEGGSDSIRFTVVIQNTHP